MIDHHDKSMGIKSINTTEMISGEDIKNNEKECNSDGSTLFSMIM